MLSSLIEELATLQNPDKNNVLFGNYTSIRYHKLIPIKRSEDNIYFVAWINQLLKRNLHLISEPHLSKVNTLIDNGEQAIDNYRNRYGEKTYNFYRPGAWFPNGNLLSRWVLFQPTDDADDTSIALRGKSHSIDYASEIKKILCSHSNGMRRRYIKRLPKKYRHIPFYSTWIGSDEIYVDTDIVILSNILMFIAQYNLPLSEEDEASLALIQAVILSGEYLQKDWSLCAWYPVKSTILYSIADLVSENYYPILDSVRTRVRNDIKATLKSEKSAVGRLLLESALLKLGDSDFIFDDDMEISRILDDSRRYSFGVIPLLHPFNGIFFQNLSRFSLFRFFYRCDAQCLAILLENYLLKQDAFNLPQNSSMKYSERKKEEQDSISRILSHSV